jgi:hypothetical protein
MAMSGNRPETVHPPDDFRTVSGHWQVQQIAALINGAEFSKAVF